MIMVLTFSLTACDKKIDPSKIETVQDTIYNADEQKDYIIASGRKGIYVLAGRYRRFGADAQAGTLLTVKGPRLFSIRSFVEQFPMYVNERVLGEMRRQEKLIRA